MFSPEDGQPCLSMQSGIGNTRAEALEPEPRFWADKRVCVTGGTGFLGWHLVRQLLPLAARVRILGLRPASAALTAQLSDVECVFGDVRDPVAVRAAVSDCDVVFHTAGTVGVWGAAL